jgi:CheY-specific phosphatase CheX
MTMITEISQAELSDIVNEIFGAMAGLQLAHSAALIPPDRHTGYIVSAVQIVGEWQGAIRLDLDLGLACRACASLTGIDAGELTSQDICDAAGELANMTAGSIRALRAPTCGLSLPTVVMGQDFDFSLSRGSIVQAESFQNECGALTISIIERQQIRKLARPIS